MVQWLITLGLALMHPSDVLKHEDLQISLPGSHRSEHVEMCMEPFMLPEMMMWVFVALVL